MLWIIPNVLQFLDRFSQCKVEEVEAVNDGVCQLVKGKREVPFNSGSKRISVFNLIQGVPAEWSPDLKKGFRLGLDQEIGLWSKIYFVCIMINTCFDSATGAQVWIRFKRARDQS